MAMAGRRRKRSAMRALVGAVFFLALGAALIIFVPRAIDSSRATQIPTPGQMTLPPTAPAVTPIATATSR